MPEAAEEAAGIPGGPAASGVCGQSAVHGDGAEETVAGGLGSGAATSSALAIGGGAGAEDDGNCDSEVSTAGAVAAEGDGVSGVRATSVPIKTPITTRSDAASVHVRRRARIASGDDEITPGGRSAEIATGEGRTESRMPPPGLRATSFTSDAGPEPSVTPVATLAAAIFECERQLSSLEARTA